MSRYIDADAMKADLDTIRTGSSYFDDFRQTLKGYIDIQPTADVVKVVRCKDCKHLYKDGECPLRTWFTHDDDDYCSYGERKDGESE